MAIKDYSTDPDLNVQISGINIAEGCPPSGINNAIRQLMADVKQYDEDLQADLEENVGTIREDTVAAAQEAARASAGESGTVTLEGVAAEVAHLGAELGELEAEVDATNQGLVGVVRSVNGVAADAAGNADIASLASGWSVPSTRVPLTLGATASRYTAPASGWFVFRKRLSSSSGFISLVNISANGFTSIDTLAGAYSGNELGAMLPVKKGDIVEAHYNISGTTEDFSFYYASGEM